MPYSFSLEFSHRSLWSFENELAHVGRTRLNATSNDTARVKRMNFIISSASCVDDRRPNLRCALLRHGVARAVAVKCRQRRNSGTKSLYLSNRDVHRRDNPSDVSTTCRACDGSSHWNP